MLTLYNNSNSIQSVRIKDRYGKHYSIFIEANRSTEIENYQLTEDIKSKISSGSLIDLSNTVVKVTPKSVVVDTIKVEEMPTIETTEDEPSVEAVEEVSVLESQPSVDTEPFICDICGNEFASKKGLEMHKSRSHK